MPTEKVYLGASTVAVALFCALVAAPSSSAQWRAQHTAGQPILVTFTPVVSAGQVIQIETGGSTPLSDLPGIADTIVTLRTSTSTAGTNLGGADGCGSLTRASCFTVTIPATYTTPRQFAVIVRPKLTSSSGVTWVRMKLGSSRPTTVCSGSTLSTSCWTTLASNVSFGAAVNGIGASATNYHFETRERPGTTTTPQLIGFAPSATSWDIRIGATAPHSNFVGLTTEFLGPLPSGITSAGVVFAGSYLTNSPIDLLRNDYGTTSGGVTFGTDADGDGIGAALEQTLYTCDGAGGTYCAGLRGCGSPSSQLCIASRRDSDQDGYEDALELYGYQNGVDDLSNMARFGADPAHYDVFLEVDLTDIDDAVPGTTCRYDEDSYVDWFEANQFVTSFRSSTAATGGFVNPDGTRGITPHLDIPPALVPSVAGPVAAGNPFYGVWGGGTCISTPGCTSDIDCEFGGVPGTCADPEVGVRQRCTRFNELAAFQTDQRRWLFNRGHILLGRGGGQTGGARQFYVGTAAGAAHELGHLGTLTHSGAAQNFATEHNFSPVFLTTMNYRTTEIGFKEVVNGSTSVPPLDTTRLDAMAFSSQTGSFDPSAMVERCVPMISSVQREALATYAQLGFASEFAAGCVNVDWDRDGTYLPAGQTTAVNQPWLNAVPGTGEDSWENHRLRRWSPSGAGSVPNIAWRRVHRAAEVVVTGTTRRLVRNELTTPVPSAEGRLTVSTSTSFTCPVLPQAAPADRYPPCDIASLPPGILTDAGAEVQTRNFAACDIASPAVAGDAALLVWQVPGSASLRWGRLDPGATTALSASGTVPFSSARNPNDAAALLSVARTTTGAVLVYRDASGALVEQVLTWSGTTAVWTAPTALASTIWTGMTGSAGVTHVYGSTDFTAGVYMAVQVGTNTLTLYRRTGPSAWTSVSTVSTPAGILGQPVIEIGHPWPQAGTPRRRVSLFARFSNRWRVQVIDSDLSTPVFRGLGSQMPDWHDFDNTGRSMATTTAAVDSQTSPPGVRGVDYDLVPYATVLSGSATCPFGATATVVGARTICFVGVTPVYADDSGAVQWGVIDCGPSSAAFPGATDGVCPSSYACTAAAEGRSICTLNGFAPMSEQRVPFADGMVQMRMEQQNEWPQMRHGYCFRTRYLRSESFTPPEYRYPRPGLLTVGATDTCTLVPTY